MAKLKVPELQYIMVEDDWRLKYKTFDEYVIHNDYNIYPVYEFVVPEFHINSKIEYSFEKGEYYIYATIDNRADREILETDLYYFKTERQYFSAVKKITKDLVLRWKNWVKLLYEKEN